MAFPDMSEFLDVAVETAESEEQTTVVEDANTTGQRFAFIGAGQAGNNIVDVLWTKFGYRRCILFNTTEHDIGFTDIPGSNHVIPSGFDGAGKDRSRGREAALLAKADVMNALQQRVKEADFIFVVTSAGGGSGSGSASVLADTAVQYLRQLGHDAEEARKRVGFIVVLPSLADGSAVLSNAGNLLKEITVDGKSSYGPMLLIDNERIKRQGKGTLADWQSKANIVAARLFDIFNSLSAMDSKIATFDPTDYKSVLFSGIINIGMNILPQGIETEASIANSISANLKGNLLVDGLDLSTGTHAALIVVGDNKNLSNDCSMNAMVRGQQTILSILGNNDEKHVVLHQGVYMTETPAVFVYSILGGLTIPASKMKLYHA